MDFSKNPLDADESPRLAKERLVHRGAGVAPAVIPLAAQHLFEEQEIHRIELEQQNEHLNAVRTQLEMAIPHSSERYTEREQRVGAVRASEALFQATFNSASIGFALCDLKGRYLMVNSAFCAMLGFSEQEMLARTFHDVSHPEDLQRDVTENRQLVAGEIQTNQYEKRYVHKHGHVVWGLASVAMARDALGAPAYLIGQVQNISERKRAEAEVLRTQKQLRELAAHSDNVREVERKRIARELHDELGQHLTALRMALSFVAQQHREKHAVVGQMAELCLQVDRMVGVVRHVISNLRPTPLDLGIVPALEWLVEDFERHSGIRCRLRIPDVAGGAGDTLTLDDARATAIFRIIQESLTNVARHSGAKKVTVSLKVGRDSIALRVQDDGKGFDPAVAIAGKSFGLLGVQERVLLLHGELHIDSAPGKGTTISFKLPLERRTRTRTGASQHPTNGNGVQGE